MTHEAMRYGTARELDEEEAATVASARRRVALISDTSGEVLSRAARNCSLDSDDLAIAQRTDRQYRQVYWRFMNTKPADRDLVRNAGCARTRRTYAAAVRAMCKRVIERNCALFDEPTDVPDEFLDTALEAIREHLSALDRLDADEQGWAQQRAGEAGKKVPGSARGSLRASKKQGLLYWGEETAQRLWDAGKGHPRFADVIALLLLAGVRPTEIERGIRVSHAVDDAGVQLKVTVRGGKCKPDALTPPLRNGARAKVTTGQQQRSLTFRPESPWAMHLVSRLEDMGGADLEITAQAKSVSDMFRRVARTAFGNRKGRLPSAYDCRHDCAAEWKTHQDAEGVAMALGHSSQATQQCYGTRRSRGRRPDRLLAVTASAPPRTSAKVRPKAAATVARLRNPPAATAVRAGVPRTTAANAPAVARAAAKAAAMSAGAAASPAPGHSVASTPSVARATAVPPTSPPAAPRPSPRP